MHHTTLRAAALCAAACCATALRARAQGGAEDRPGPPPGAIARALADSLRADAVRAVAADSADSLAGPLARALGVPLVRRPAVPGEWPPCSWGGPAAGNPRAGYYATLLRARDPRPAAARAVVVAVTLSCDNPPGYLHDVFSRWREYTVGRVGRRWRVIAVGGGGIT